MAIQYFPEMEQGSEPWFAARCGLLTASEMKHIITPKTLKPVNKGEVSDHHFDLLSQRISKYVEPSYQSDDMLRGKLDEVDAAILYDKKIDKLEKVGFVTNDEWGFKIGYSPDAVVIVKKKPVEFKSRAQKFQVRTIIEDAMPDDFRIQVNTGMLVMGVPFLDFGSYCGGWPFFTKEVPADTEVQGAIIEAATIFEKKMAELMATYLDRIAAMGDKLIQTERRKEEPLAVGTYE